MAMVVGMIIPPPMAWITRAKISEFRLHARVHRRDPATNAAMDRMYSRLKPMRSPSHPESGTTTPRASM